MSFLTPLTSIAQTDWWRSFGDSRLDTLVALAMARNGEVASGQARIAAAQERVFANRAYYLPNVYLDPLVQQQSLAPNRPLPIAAQGTRLTLKSFALPIDVSYDVNFWQKRVLVGQAQNITRQEAASLEQTRLDLAAAVVRSYVQVRGADLRLAVIRRNSLLLDSVNQLLSARYRAGLTNAVSLTLNKTERQALEIDLESAYQQRQTALADLEGLTATPGLQIPEDTTLGPEPEIDTLTTPSLAASRPDVQLFAYQVDNARLVMQQLDYNRLPRPFVAASTGLVSQRVEHLVDNNSFTYTVGAGIAIPIWDWRNNRYHVRAARQDVRSREALYRQQVVTAQANIRSAIVSVQRTRRQLRSNEAASRTAAQAVRLTAELYTRGITTFLELLNAERNIIALDQQRAQLRAAYLTNIATYWQARGGR